MTSLTRRAKLDMVGPTDGRPSRGLTFVGKKKDEDVSHREPVCVCRPKDEWQAELIVQYLRTNGVDAYLANRAIVGVWGFSSRPFGELEILVPYDQQDAAVRLLKDSDDIEEDRIPPF